MFDQLSMRVHDTAQAKRFWPEPEEVNDIFIAKQCMMIVSEVTEVMDAVRKSKGREEITKEIADILIRTLDLYQGMYTYGYVDHSLDEMFKEKTEYNKTRPEKHGVRF